MKRVVVTGASGFIGSALIKLLSSTDWDVIPFVRNSISHDNEVIMDFRDPGFVNDLNSLPEVNAVVHLAAMPGFDQPSMELLFEPNVFSTAAIAQFALKREAYLLFSSGAVIVCGTKKSCITAETKLEPDTNYGYSKWLAEEIIKMSNANYCILRIGGVFGVNGPCHLSLNKSIDRALRGVRPVMYGDGMLKRNYLYVKDLASIFLFCLENRINGTHLVSGSYANTMYEMLHTICDLLLDCDAPELRDGDSGSDQIIEHSQALPKGRSFEDAVCDIKKDVEDDVL
jgi:UDP-glucose 4-epimerase